MLKTISNDVLIQDRLTDDFIVNAKVMHYSRSSQDVLWATKIRLRAFVLLLFVG